MTLPPPANAGIRLSVVVLAWNEAHDLARCLDALAAHPDVAGQEVIVVDNGSSDGTERVLARRPNVRVVRNATNLGITRARNQGLRLAVGRHVAMLDSDTLVREGALTSLCTLIDERPDVGLVGPRRVYPDGRLQLSCRRFPTPSAVLANRASTVPGLGKLPARRRHLMVDDPHDRRQQADYVLGACMVFRRAAASEVRGFDEEHGNSTPGGYGFDDADFALRLARIGWKVLYEPAAVVVHDYRRRLAARPFSRQTLGLVRSFLHLKRAGSRPKSAA